MGKEKFDPVVEDIKTKRKKISTAFIKYNLFRDSLLRNF
jgi:hypothetical protein